jgi:hypothetical protein
MSRCSEWSHSFSFPLSNNLCVILSPLRATRPADLIQFYPAIPQIFVQTCHSETSYLLRATCPTHLIPLYPVIPLIFVKAYYSETSSLLRATCPTHLIPFNPVISLIFIGTYHSRDLLFLNFPTPFYFFFLSSKNGPQHPAM